MLREGEELDIPDFDDIYGSEEEGEEEGEDDEYYSDGEGSVSGGKRRRREGEVSCPQLCPVVTPFPLPLSLHMRHVERSTYGGERGEQDTPLSILNSPLSSVQEGDTVQVQGV